MFLFPKEWGDNMFFLCFPSTKEVFQYFVTYSAHFCSAVIISPYGGIKVTLVLNSLQWYFERIPITATPDRMPDYGKIKVTSKKSNKISKEEITLSSFNNCNFWFEQWLHETITHELRESICHIHKNLKNYSDNFQCIH